MSVSAIGAEILGGVESTPPPWYTSLEHPMALGVNTCKSTYYILQFIMSIHMHIFDKSKRKIQVK